MAVVVISVVLIIISLLLIRYPHKINHSLYQNRCEGRVYNYCSAIYYKILLRIGGSLTNEGDIVMDHYIGSGKFIAKQTFECILHVQAQGH